MTGALLFLPSRSWAPAAGICCGRAGRPGGAETRPLLPWCPLGAGLQGALAPSAVALPFWGGPGPSFLSASGRPGSCSSWRGVPSGTHSRGPPPGQLPLQTPVGSQLRGLAVPAGPLSLLGFRLVATLMLTCSAWVRLCPHRVSLPGHQLQGFRAHPHDPV